MKRQVLDVEFKFQNQLTKQVRTVRAPIIVDVGTLVHQVNLRQKDNEIVLAFRIMNGN